MARGVPISRNQKLAIRRMYNNGTPTRDILKKFAISRSSLYNVLVNTGREQPPTKITRRDQDVIARMNYRGFSDAAIAERTGIPERTVSWHRNKLGLPVVPATERRNKEW